MATRALQQPIYAGNRYGGSRRFAGGIEQEDTILEAASQSWGAGALIYQTSGKFAICTATSKVFGQAQRAASGTTSNKIENLAIIRPGDRFYMNVYHATAASAVWALTMIGLQKRIIVISGKFHVDIETGSAGGTISDGTNVYPFVQVVGFHPDDAATDVYGRVLVEFGQISIATDGDPQGYWLQGAA